MTINPKTFETPIHMVTAQVARVVSADTLKLAALGLMLADHVHLVFFSRSMDWLYWLTRIVFPLFALIVAHNLEHHRANPRRYLSRLLLYGVVAQPVHWLCFGLPLLNVMFTLASGIGLWWLLQTLESRGVHVALRYGLITLVALNLTFLEFGWSGALAVPVYAALLRRSTWWGWLGCVVLSFDIVRWGEPWIMPLIAVGLWMLTAKRSPGPSVKKSRLMRHAAYAFYPLHLALIAVISMMVS
jgi:hypothetical protein